MVVLKQFKLQDSVVRFKNSIVLFLAQRNAPNRVRQPQPCVCKNHVLFNQAILYRFVLGGGVGVGVAANPCVLGNVCSPQVSARFT